MRRSPSQRNDLVIGMTLAEVFLLLLIVGWYGSRLESEGAGVTSGPPKPAIEEELKEKTKALKEANREIADQKMRIGKLEEVLDWIGRTIGYPKPIRDTGSAEDALKAHEDRVKASARRGKPACLPNRNTLVEVTVDGDTVALVLREALSTTSKSYAKDSRFTKTSEIEALLAAVRTYYSERVSTEAGECVFDYTLAWRTDRDFRIGKKTFEAFFYPAGDRQISD